MFCRAFEWNTTVDNSCWYVPWACAFWWECHLQNCILTMNIDAFCFLLCITCHKISLHNIMSSCCMLNIAFILQSSCVRVVGLDTNNWGTYQHSSAISDLDRQNTGKATVLGDAARVLRDLVTQVESLRKEQSALLSEQQYVSFWIQALYILGKKFWNPICCMNFCVPQRMETNYITKGRRGLQAKLLLCLLRRIKTYRLLWVQQMIHWK